MRKSIIMQEPDLSKLKPGEKLYSGNFVYERRANGTLDVGLHFTEEVLNVETGEIERLPEQSRTQQQFKDDCDVNKIIEKYTKTGTVTHVRNAQKGVYADLTQLPDYQTALNTVIKAEQTFLDVPAEVRAKFKNDPQEFIQFLSDPKNDEEAISLGLKTRPIPPKPDPNTELLQQIQKNTKPKQKPQPPSDDV